MFIYKLVVIFTGCFPGNVSYHGSFTKNGDIKIQNVEEIWIEMGYEESLKPYDFYIDLTDAEKNMKSPSVYRITIPIVYTDTRQAYIPAAAIDLCSKRYPFSYEELDKHSLKINTLVKFTSSEPLKASILTTPFDLHKRGLIDDDNLTKGELCIYPSINIWNNTMKDGDIVKITSNEMDNG